MIKTNHHDWYTTVLLDEMPKFVMTTNYDLWVHEKFVI